MASTLSRQAVRTKGCCHRQGGGESISPPFSIMILETIILALGVSSMVSYETTGKGLADHTISAVASRDCKIARVVHNEQVCQTEPIGIVTVLAPIARDTVARANDVFAQRARAAK